MAELQGTKVIAPIVPVTDADSYATGYMKYLAGGWRNVATLADRDAISPQRKEGEITVVYVQEEDRFYLWDISSSTWVELPIGGSKGQTLNGTTNPIIWDGAEGNLAEVLMQGGATLQDIQMSNLDPRKTYTIFVTQDSFGGVTPVFLPPIGVTLKWAGGQTPTFSIAPNATDVITFAINPSGTIVTGTAVLNFQETAPIEETTFIDSTLTIPTSFAGDLTYAEVNLPLVFAIAQLQTTPETTGNSAQAWVRGYYSAAYREADRNRVAGDPAPEDSGLIFEEVVNGTKTIPAKIGGSIALPGEDAIALSVVNQSGLDQSLGLTLTYANLSRSWATGGSAVQTITRTTASGVAPAASSSVDFSLAPLYKIVEAETDYPATVRVYPTSALRDTDTGEGLIVEFTTTAGGLVRNLASSRVGANITSDVAYAVIINNDSVTRQVQITLKYFVLLNL